LSIAQQLWHRSSHGLRTLPRAQELTELARDFIATEIEPVEAAYHRDQAPPRGRPRGRPWQELPVIKELQAKARAQGLWNLFLPPEHEGPYAERYGTDGGEGLSTSTTRRSPS
jgi:acyl-CoA dehydrogenase